MARRSWSNAGARLRAAWTETVVHPEETRAGAGSRRRQRQTALRRWRRWQRWRRWLGLVVLASVSCQDAKPRPTHLLHDLVAEFFTAEIRRPSTIIDLGDPTARTSLIRGWSNGSRALPGGGRAAWSLGQVSEMEFFVSYVEDLELVLRCAAVVPQIDSRPQRLSLSVNGVPAAEVELTANLEEHRVLIPSRLLQVGDNRLQFAHPERSGVDSPARDLRMLWDFVRFERTAASPPTETLVDQRRSILFVGCGTRVDYYLDLPGESYLEALSTRRVGTSSERLEIIFKEESGNERTLSESRSKASKGALLKLTGSRPIRGRLSLFAKADEPCGEDDGFVVRSPRVLGSKPPTATRPIVATASTPGRSAAKGVDRPNVIVYLIDALRTDHMSCYGYNSPTTPNLDRFASQAYLFSNAQAQSPWTRSSVASLFTGLWPQVHATNHDDAVLPSSIPTLAALLKQAGYRTVGVTGNGNVSKTFGFSNGFDQYRYLAFGEEGEILARSSQINQAVFSLLPSLKRHSPFFLYIHTVDPHAPYDPPPAFRARFAPQVEDPKVGSIAELLELQNRHGEVQETTREELLALYDGEIAANDASFGALITKLESLRLFDNSLIVVLSDHGEEFLDHGDWTHGKTLYSEMLDVPLIMKLPGDHPPREIESIVQHVDIMPTILELAGLPAPPSIQGQSLLPLVTAPDGPWRDTAVAHLDLRGRVATSLIRGRWKIIQPFSPDGNAFPELYDRTADIPELHNLAPERSDLAKFLVATRKIEEAHVESLPVEPVSGELDRRVVRGLKALGYLE